MINRPRIQWLNWAVLLLCACTGPTNSLSTEKGTASPATAPVTDAATAAPSEVSQITANVLSVQISGAPGEYTLAVEIASPDENCFQYADWWEVVDEEGKLLYRRVLTHSHADEQPFTRSGGPVPLEPDTIVWIRAHMNVGGYGGAAMKGSVQAGFNLAELSADFAPNLANQPPLPQDCAF